MRPDIRIKHYGTFYLFFDVVVGLIPACFRDDIRLPFKAGVKAAVYPLVDQSNNFSDGLPFIYS